MALLDATTDYVRSRVLATLSGEVHDVAFAAANPVLVRAIAQMRQNPRHSSTLTVDSVVEAVRIIEDADLLEQIVRNDSRQAVTCAARTRLRQLKADGESGELVTNGQKIAERTARILAKPLASVPELLAKAKELDGRLIEQWFDRLSDAELASVYPSLLGSGAAVAVVQYRPARLVAVAQLSSDEVAVGALAGRLAELKCQNLMVEALKMWPGPWDLRAGALALHAFGKMLVASAHDDFPRPVVGADVVQMWSEIGRWDLVLWTGSASVETIVSFARDAAVNQPAVPAVRSLIAPQRTLVDMLLASVNSAGDADLVVSTLCEANPSMLLPSMTAEQVLRLPGISEETLRLVISRTGTPRAMAKWLSGQYPSQPTRELVKVMVAAAPQFAPDMFQLASHSSYGQVPEPFLWAADEVCSSVPGSAAKVARFFQPALWGEFFAERATARLGLSSSAWEVFFTLLREPGELTFDALLETAVQLSA